MDFSRSVTLLKGTTREQEQNQPCLWTPSFCVPTIPTNPSTSSNPCIITIGKALNTVINMHFQPTFFFLTLQSFVIFPEVFFSLPFHTIQITHLLDSQESSAAFSCLCYKNMKLTYQVNFTLLLHAQINVNQILH